MDSAFRWQTVLDFAVLAAAIYLVLRWSREARALRVALAILALEATAQLAGYFGLVIAAWILHGASIGAALILIVLFQPELRHALNRLDVALRLRRPSHVLLPALEAISTAAFSLAAAKRGALIVLARRDQVDEMVQHGVHLGGRVSPEILEAIFRKVSPVHDGAAVVEGDQITRVSAILPLSERRDLPRDWGTRHRAAMGLAERCDALVIAASEQRGEVTLLHDGTFEQMERSDQLTVALRSLTLVPSPSAARRYLTPKELGLQAIAIGLAAVIWTITYPLAGETVRFRTVPIEFTGLAASIRIGDQSATTTQVRLRGTKWRLESIGEGQVIAHASLTGLEEGVHSVAVTAQWSGPPAGVALDGVSPPFVTVRLVRDGTTPKSPSSTAKVP